MDRRVAAQCARLSELAYDDLATMRAAVPSAAVELIDIDDTQVYLIAWPDRAFCVYRGTQISGGWSWPDIKTNLLRGKKSWFGRTGQRVHGGYFEAFMAAARPVRAFADHHHDCGRPLYHTGHSLGGVLATLAASAVPATASYSFGAPRVGNAAFATGLADCRHYRVVHARDIAPTYPFVTLGYRHGGERWQLSRTGTLHRGQCWRDVLALSLLEGAIPERIADILPDPLTGLADHAVGAYARLLNAP